jgi:hypothetical protein
MFVWLRLLHTTPRTCYVVIGAKQTTDFNQILLLLSLIYLSFVENYLKTRYDYKGRSPSNGKLSDFSFYIDSQISVHRKFKK